MIICLSIILLIIILELYACYIAYDRAITVVMNRMYMQKEQAKQVIWGFLQEVISSSNKEPNWIADDILIDNLLTVQAPYNCLPKHLTMYNSGYYANTIIPCVSIQCIPRNNANFNALKVSLRNTVIQRLAYLGQANVNAEVLFIPKSNTDIVINVLYTVTNTQKSALHNLMTAQHNTALTQARTNNQKLTDKALEADLQKGSITPSNSQNKLMQIGYDVQTRTPITIDMLATGMFAIVGGTGSGKSVASLYMLYNLLKTYPDTVLYIADFKQSKDYIGITNHYAEASDTTALVEKFYDVFTNTPESNNYIQLLIIDEYAGYMTWLAHIDKKKADEIKGKIATILMMGRSRRCYIWSIQQRITATLFPAGIGAIDNFQVCIGLGRLSPDSRKSLFAGEHMADINFEAQYQPSTGQGLVLVDGKALQALEMPHIKDKKALSNLLH